MYSLKRRLESGSSPSSRNGAGAGTKAVSARLVRGRGGRSEFPGTGVGSVPQRNRASSGAGWLAAREPVVIWNRRHDAARFSSSTEKSARCFLRRADRVSTMSRCAGMEQQRWQKR